MADFPLAVDEAHESIAVSGHPDRVPSGKSIIEADSVFENGRTYQAYKSQSYMLPNDCKEQDRLNLQHAEARILLGDKLALAPIDRLKQVFDLMTGTGIWAIEFAQEHPQANVVGTDLSMIQLQGVAENSRFIKEDAEAEVWTLGGPFDYIHMRFGVTAVKNHERLFRRIYDHLVPGGWAELQDTCLELSSFDGTSVSSALGRWTELLVQGLATIGINAVQYKNAKQMMLAAGFVDVVEHVLPLPCNGWPRDPRFKTLGKYHAINSLDLLSGSTDRMLAAAGTAPEVIEDLRVRAKADLLGNSVHGYWPVHVVYGRKP